jgi:hypothetical protein
LTGLAVAGANDPADIMGGQGHRVALNAAMGGVPLAAPQHYPTPLQQRGRPAYVHQGNQNPNAALSPRRAGAVRFVNGQRVRIPAAPQPSDVPRVAATTNENADPNNGLPTLWRGKDQARIDTYGDGNAPPMRGFPPPGRNPPPMRNGSPAPRHMPPPMPGLRGFCGPREPARFGAAVPQIEAKERLRKYYQRVRDGVATAHELLVGSATDEIGRVNAKAKSEAFTWPASRTNSYYTTNADQVVVLDWARRVMVQNAIKFLARGGDYGGSLVMADRYRNFDGFTEFWAAAKRAVTDAANFSDDVLAQWESEGMYVDIINYACQARQLALADASTVDNEVEATSVAVLAQDIEEVETVEGETVDDSETSSSAFDMVNFADAGGITVTTMIQQTVLSNGADVGELSLTTTCTATNEEETLDASALTPASDTAPGHVYAIKRDQDGASYVIGLVPMELPFIVGVDVTSMSTTKMEWCKDPAVWQQACDIFLRTVCRPAVDESAA